MVEQQIVTIRSDGTLQGLERPGKFDFKKMGKASIQRSTNIVWIEDLQTFAIQFLQDLAPKIGIAKNLYLTLPKIVNSRFTLPNRYKIADSLLCFDSYEEAVKLEIAFLDHLRLTEQLI